MALENIWGYLTNNPGNPFIGMLTDDGTPGGNCEANGDYSVVNQDFLVGPAEGVDYLSLSLSVYLTVAPPLDKDYYGQIVPGLTNGLDIIFKRGSYEVVLNPRGPIKAHKDYVIAGAKFTDTDLNGGSTLGVFEFDFLKDFGAGQILHGASQEKLVVRLRDDLSTLDVHCFAINGRQRQIHRT
jgi:hypothetical protein